MDTKITIYLSSTKVQSLGICICTCYKWHQQDEIHAQVNAKHYKLLAFDRFYQLCSNIQSDTILSHNKLGFLTNIKAQPRFLRVFTHILYRVQFFYNFQSIAHKNKLAISQDSLFRNVAHNQSRCFKGCD